MRFNYKKQNKIKNYQATTETLLCFVLKGVIILLYISTPKVACHWCPSLNGWELQDGLSFFPVHLGVTSPGNGQVSVLRLKTLTADKISVTDDISAPSARKPALCTVHSPR